MAAVTIDKVQYNSIGNKRQQLYTLDIATSGDTLATGMTVIDSVNTNDVAITLSAVSGGTVTFTTTGAVANALVEVIGN